MDLETYRTTFNEDDPAPGWDAIDTALSKIYGTTEPLVHWGTVVKHMLGGPDPLDGISVYGSNAGGRSHWHVVSYGFSELYYNEDSLDKEFSKFGFELTFRLLTEPEWTPENDSAWTANLMQNIARHIFSSGEWFEPYHWIPANGPIKANDDTLIQGFVFVEDAELPAIDTPHGQVQFLQMVGVTDQEIAAIMDKSRTPGEVVEGLRAADPLLVCDLKRKN